MDRHSLNYTEIGMRIRKLRKAKGLTQEQLADLIGGVSSNHISKVETGNTSISLNVFINLADAFDVTLDFLMFGNLKESQSVNDTIIKTILDGFTEHEKDYVIYLLKGIQLFAKSKE